MFFADPFSLADPPVVTGILEDAGFREALDRLDSDAAARALGRLRVILAEHNGGRGVRFNSRAWIVTARR